MNRVSLRCDQMCRSVELKSQAPVPCPALPPPPRKLAPPFQNAKVPSKNKPPPPVKISLLGPVKINLLGPPFQNAKVLPKISPPKIGPLKI